MTRRVEPTRVRTLAFVAVGVAIISWAVVRALYGEIPPLRWYMPLWIGIVAVAEAVFAWRLRQQIRRAPGTEPPDPIVAARAVALAKASAYVGAALVGMWGGAFVHTVSEWGRLVAARGDALVSLGGVVLSAALTGAGLWLEYACRAPDLLDDPERGT